MTIPAALIDAYRASVYRVALPDGPLDLAIGATSAALDALLARHDLQEWAFITAYNPRSIPSDAAANRAADAALRRAIAERGWPRYDGAGVPADQRWLPEPSHLVLGIDLAAAIALARCFDQNAIVAGRRGEAARLIDCTDDP